MISQTRTATAENPIHIHIQYLPSNPVCRNRILLFFVRFTISINLISSAINGFCGLVIDDAIAESNGDNNIISLWCTQLLWAVVYYYYDSSECGRYACSDCHLWLAPLFSNHKLIKKKWLALPTGENALPHGGANAFISFECKIYAILCYLSLVLFSFIYRNYFYFIVKADETLGLFMFARKMFLMTLNCAKRNSTGNVFAIGVPDIDIIIARALI